MFINITCAKVPNDDGFTRDDLWFMQHSINATAIVDVADWAEYVTLDDGETEPIEEECLITLDNGDSFFAEYGYKYLMQLIYEALGEKTFANWLRDRKNGDS